MTYTTITTTVHRSELTVVPAADLLDEALALAQRVNRKIHVPPAPVALPPLEEGDYEPHTLVPSPRSQSSHRSMI